jgi:hypothetical protein
MSGFATLVPDPVKKWLAFGSGVGISISGPHGAESLQVAAVRARPGGARLLGTLSIEDAAHQAAGVWGTEYAAFLRQHDLSHVAATVLLPRREVIVRQVALPGVAEKDLAGAIEFQLDGLHPYREEEAVSSWVRIPGSSSVLIAITRRAVVQRFTTLFAEAGIKIGAFTCSAAAIYAALRMFRPAEAKQAAASGFLAYEITSAGVEIYGESATHPALSATFELPAERAASLAAAELRLEPDSPLKSLEDLLGATPALPYAAALASACPLLALPLNLLPSGMRSSGSRAMWVPSAALGAAVLLLAVALSAYPRYENRRYLDSLNAAIAKVAPAANRATALDRQIETARNRTLMLDEMRRRSKLDMDVLNEMTRILPPPAWLNLLELNRTQVTIAGETAQAAPLLQVIDNSPLFQGSEFAMPPARVKDAEAFRIKTNREPGK